MEPNEVLKKFLDFCSNKDDQCHKYSFASNGIVEWFGRNIKDNNKIFDYFRYNISHQYEHIFSVATKCEAFEEKTIHKTTRNQPSEMSNILPRASTNIYITPPSSSVSTEFDTLCTPPKKSLPIPSEQEKQKKHFSDSDDDCEKLSPSITRHLRKRTIISPHPISPNKRKKTETEQTIFPQSDMSSSYCCEIKYIEARGTVRKLRKLKHRGIDAGSKDIRNFESPDRNHDVDENTKLKISYRENMDRNDIQFVLVLYQHIENNPRCKRDLMAEFTKTCIDEASERKIEKKPKINKTVKMRRLRF